MDHPAAFVGGTLRRMASFFWRHGITIWLAALPILLTVVLVRRHEEIRRVAAALRAADPTWLLVAGGVEAFVLLSTALTYQVILRRLGHDLPCVTLARAHLQRIFVGTVAPLSGPASVCSFVRSVGHQRVTASDALTTVALRTFVGHGALLLMLLAALALRGSLESLLLVSAVVTAGVVLLPAIRRRSRTRSLGPHGWHRRLPGGVSRWLVDYVARFRRHEIALGDLATPLALTIAVRLGGIALLLASLRALGVEASLGVAVGAYCAAMIASATVPFFQGAGVVEAATAVALRHAGVQPDVAVGAALLWRLFDFWLPLTVGLLIQAVGLLWPALTPVARPAPTEATAEAA